MNSTLTSIRNQQERGGFPVKHGRVSVRGLVWHQREAPDRSRRGRRRSTGMRAREAHVRACVCAPMHAHLRARRVYRVRVPQVLAIVPVLPCSRIKVISDHSLNCCAPLHALGHFSPCSLAASPWAAGPPVPFRLVRFQMTLAVRAASGKWRFYNLFPHLGRGLSFLFTAGNGCPEL